MLLLICYGLPCFFDLSEPEIMALQEKGRIQNTVIVDYPNFSGSRFFTNGALNMVAWMLP